MWEGWCHTLPSSTTAGLRPRPLAERGPGAPVPPPPPPACCPACKAPGDQHCALCGGATHAPGTASTCSIHLDQGVPARGVVCAACLWTTPGEQPARAAAALRAAHCAGQVVPQQPPRRAHGTGASAAPSSAPTAGSPPPGAPRVAMHGDRTPSASPQWTCRACGVDFTSIRRKRDHLCPQSHWHHLCRHCGERFQSERKLRDHHQTACAARKAASTCLRCERVFKNRKALAAHRRRCRGGPSEQSSGLPSQSSSQAFSDPSHCCSQSSSLPSQSCSQSPSLPSQSCSPPATTTAPAEGSRKRRQRDSVRLDDDSSDGDLDLDLDTPPHPRPRHSCHRVYRYRGYELAAWDGEPDQEVAALTGATDGTDSGGEASSDSAGEALRADLQRRMAARRRAHEVQPNTTQHWHPT